MKYPYKKDLYIEGLKGITELEQLAGIYDSISRETILRLVAEEKTLARELRDYVAGLTKEQARAELFEAGIIDENGELTKPYK